MFLLVNSNAFSKPRNDLTVELKMNHWNNLVLSPVFNNGKL